MLFLFIWLVSELLLVTDCIVIDFSHSTISVKIITIVVYVPKYFNLIRQKKYIVTKEYLPLSGEHEYIVREDLSGELEAVFIDFVLALLNEPANLIDRHHIYIYVVDLLKKR